MEHNNTPQLLKGTAVDLGELFLEGLQERGYSQDAQMRVSQRSLYNHSPDISLHPLATPSAAEQNLHMPEAMQVSPFSLQLLRFCHSDYRSEQFPAGLDRATKTLGDFSLSSRFPRENTDHSQQQEWQARCIAPSFPQRDDLERAHKQVSAALAALNTSRRSTTDDNFGDYESFDSSPGPSSSNDQLTDPSSILLNAQIKNIISEQQSFSGSAAIPIPGLGTAAIPIRSQFARQSALEPRQLATECPATVGFPVPAPMASPLFGEIPVMRRTAPVQNPKTGKLPMSENAAGAVFNERSLPMKSCFNSDHALRTVKVRKDRGEKKHIPEHQKDARYFERRRKNNFSAKKSRDIKKLKEEQTEEKAKFFEQANRILRIELARERVNEEALHNMLLNNMLKKRKDNMANMTSAAAALQLDQPTTS